MNIIDRRNLDFLLIEWLRLGDLLERPRFADHDLESIAAVLDLAERLSAEQLAPTLRPSDTHEPWMDADGGVHVLPEVAKAIREIAAAGLFSSVFDAERGGLQLPYLAHMAMLGTLMSGSIAAASYMLLTVANARLIATFGTPAQIEAFAAPQIAGRALGTMCLSEPQAGSSLADIATRAVADGEDELGRRYRINGAKMWISGGDHDITDDIVHLVLAKAAGPDGVVAQGTRGISLFIVPKRLPSGELNDVVVAGLNHKMGYRGLPNCALNFGEGRTLPDGRNGAVGWLVGEVGQGLPQMFQMMNEARVSVGLGGAVLAGRGHMLSLAYAHARPQGRPPGSRSGEQVPIVQHADVQRMLLAQKSYAEGALALVLYTARLLDVVHSGCDNEAGEAEALLAVLTPIAKTWPSEWAQRALDHAIQIHGGAGYTRDFDVELLYRDNRLNPIHEGTTGIQGIDLVGRKLRRERGGGFDVLRRRVAATLERARVHPAFAAEAVALSSACAALAGAAEMLMTEFEEAEAIAAATPFLFAAGHVVVGWLWLDQALCCDPSGQNSDADPRFRAGKIAACRYFSAFELPKVSAWLSPVVEANALRKIFPTDVFAEPYA